MVAHDTKRMCHDVGVTMVPQSITGAILRTELYTQHYTILDIDGLLGECQTSYPTWTVLFKIWSNYVWYLLPCPVKKERPVFRWHLVVSWFLFTMLNKKFNFLNFFWWQAIWDAITFVLYQTQACHSCIPMHNIVCAHDASVGFLFKWVVSLLVNNKNGTKCMKLWTYANCGQQGVQTVFNSTSWSHMIQNVCAMMSASQWCPSQSPEPYSGPSCTHNTIQFWT